MSTKSILLAVVLFAVSSMPSISVSQSITGRYATTNHTSTTTELPDGTTVQMTAYTHVAFADDSNWPYDGMISDCHARYVISKERMLVSAHGTCTSMMGEGNSHTYWWRMEEAGTTDCPTMCGSIRTFNGTGKYPELSGTFRRTTLFPDRSVGTWEATVK